MIKIFDTHTHLNVDNFAGKEQEEVDFAAELGVVKMNIVGFDKATIKKSLALSEQYDQLYSTIGWHPTEAGSYTQEIEDMIVSQLGRLVWTIIGWKILRRFRLRSLSVK